MISIFSLKLILDFFRGVKSKINNIRSNNVPSVVDTILGVNNKCSRLRNYYNCDTSIHKSFLFMGDDDMDVESFRDLRLTDPERWEEMATE